MLQIPYALDKQFPTINSRTSQILHMQVPCIVMNATLSLTTHTHTHTHQKKRNSNNSKATLQEILYGIRKILRLT